MEIPLAIRLAKMADFVTELEESMRHCKNPSSMASRTPKIENEKLNIKKTSSNINKPLQRRDAKSHVPFEN